jgi:Bacterial PH domain
MWRRPYFDPVRIFTGALAGAGTLIFTTGVGQIVIGARDVWVPGMLGLVGFGAGWLTFAWRLHRTALVVSDRGVRIRWLPFTRTIAWSSIKEFRTLQGQMDSRLVVVLDDGTRLWTPVRQGRLFARMRIRDGGTRLDPIRYEQLLTELNALMVAARSASSSAVADGGVTPAPVPEPPPATVEPLKAPGVPTVRPVTPSMDGPSVDDLPS